MSHASDCAVNNMPAYKPDLCDCGVDPVDEHDKWARDQWDKAHGSGNRREAGRQMRKLIAELRRATFGER